MAQSVEWYYHERYAVRKEGSRKPFIWMHKLIANTPDDMETDHIDRDSLNNQRANLRHCTHRQNTFNRLRKKLPKSGYKGVYFHKQSGKWRAKVNGLSVGLFPTAEAAAEAYSDAAKKAHGEFARPK